MPEGNKKVFLVEDDPAIIDIYQTMIKRANINVEVLISGQEVIKKIKNIEAGQEAKPDLILLDLILPDMNGMEILKEIKKSSATNKVTVFILTNQADAESQQSEDAKPDKFIIKANITPTQLLEVIKKQLGQS